MVIKAYYEIEVIDRNGKVIKRLKRRSHSWLRQFIQILKAEYATRSGTGTGHANESILDTTGATRTYPSNSSSSYYSYQMNQSALAAAGDASYGIVVGSGSTANSLTTYGLASPIAHGSASGQLLYQDTTVGVIENPSGMNLRFSMSRMFINDSGASITIQEIGLVIRKIDSGGTYRNFMVARDVLSSPISLPNGATLKVIYTIGITVG